MVFIFKSSLLSYYKINGSLATTVYEYASFFRHFTRRNDVAACCLLPCVSDKTLSKKSNVKRKMFL